jgi:ATP/maltotriose-dependent transcriptional regulator MalT
VSALLDELVVRRPLVATPEDEAPGPRDYHFLEAAVLTGHAEAAALLLRRFQEHPLVVSNWWHPLCPARLFGAAAALLGDRERARRWSEQALTDATRVRFRPEIALTRLQLAELLADAGESHRREALEHLDFAVFELREMKMQPSLERALAIKRSLQA